MIRRFITILSVLSLLLCIAVAVIWVRSYFVGDTFGRDRVEQTSAGKYWIQDRLFIRRGGVGVGRFIGGPFLREQIETKPFFHETISHSAGHTTLGFSFHRRAINEPGSRPRHQFEVVVPLWPILILSAILPCVRRLRSLLLSHAVRRRTLRILSGNCPSCSYDLRAHRGGDRCPECGARIPAYIAPKSKDA